MGRNHHWAELKMWPAACQPVDALERLHMEWALGELEAGPEYP
jgi:hypothetical protein